MLPRARVHTLKAYREGFGGAGEALRRGGAVARAKAIGSCRAHMCSGVRRRRGGPQLSAVWGAASAGGIAAHILGHLHEQRGVVCVCVRARTCMYACLLL